MALVYQKKIPAKQMSLYNFIILREKKTPTQVFFCEICQTLTKWWLLLKTRNILLHNKILRRA